MYEVQGASVIDVQKTATDLALLDIEPFGNALHVRVAQDGPDAQKLFAELTRRGVPVTGVSDAEVTLEDVFLQVVGGAAKPSKAPAEAKLS
jgi:hypothetical protein